jgi:hypothetical protein
MLNQFRRSMLPLLSLTLLISMIPAVFTIPAESLLFRPEPYQQALMQNEVYARIPAWMAEMLIGGQVDTPTGLDAASMQYLGQAEYERLLRLLLPSDWLEVQGLVMLTQVWDFLNFRTTDMVLTVDMVPVKARLAGVEGQEVAQSVLNSWPGCSDEQLLTLASQALSGQVTVIPFCRPPDEYAPQFLGFVQSGLSSFAAALPDQVTLTVLFDLAGREEGEQTSLSQTVFTVYRVGRAILRLAPFLAILSALLMALLTFGRWRLMLSGFGTPLMLAGAAALVLTALLFLSTEGISEFLIRLYFITRPEGLYQALAETLSDVIGRFALFSAIAALASIFIGFVLAVVSRLIEE